MALLTPSVFGCGATVDVAFEQSPVVGVDAAVGLDAGLPPINRSCGTKQAESSCGAAEVVDCSGEPQLVTRLEPLDCDIARGFTGDPEEVARDCQDAFNGQSGDGCSGERACVRRTLVGCCLELAACQGEPPILLRSRACVQNCLASSPTVDRSELFEGCSPLLAALARSADPYRVLGAPCRGDFVCSEGLGETTGRELRFMDELRVFFCVGGQVQILDALPWFDVVLPSPDAGADAGYADAGYGDAGFDGGFVDAGPQDASFVDAGGAEAGSDAEARDAGLPADAARDAGYMGPDG